MLPMAKDNKGGEGKNEKQSYREGGPEQRVHETQCSCGENSLSISPFPRQVFLTENPSPVSSPVIGNLTYAGTWHVYITPKAFLLTPVKCVSCKEASTSELWLCTDRHYNCSLEFPWAWQCSWSWAALLAGF